MNIIVEGVDASGKSSFVKKLAKLTGREVVRGSSFEMSKAGTDEMFEKLKEMISENNNLIINRFFYSNLVYGKLYNYPMISKEQCEELKKLVDETCTVYYLCASPETLRKRLEYRGDDKITSDELDDISLAYEKMWKENMPATLLTIDTDDDKLLDENSEVYHKIIENDKNMDFIDGLKGDF